MNNFGGFGGGGNNNDHDDCIHHLFRQKIQKCNHQYDILELILTYHAQLYKSINNYNMSQVYDKKQLIENNKPSFEFLQIINISLQKINKTIMYMLYQNRHVNTLINHFLVSNIWFDNQSFYALDKIDTEQKNYNFQLQNNPIGNGNNYRLYRTSLSRIVDFIQGNCADSQIYVNRKNQFYSMKRFRIQVKIINKQSSTSQFNVVIEDYSEFNNRKSIVFQPVSFNIYKELQIGQNYQFNVVVGGSNIRVESVNNMSNQNIYDLPTEYIAQEDEDEQEQEEKDNNENDNDNDNDNDEKKNQQIELEKKVKFEWDNSPQFVDWLFIEQNIINYHDFNIHDNGNSNICKYCQSIYQQDLLCSIRDYYKYTIKLDIVHILKQCEMYKQIGMRKIAQKTQYSQKQSIWVIQKMEKIGQMLKTNINKFQEVIQQICIYGDLYQQTGQKQLLDDMIQYSNVSMVMNNSEGKMKGIGQNIFKQVLKEWIYQVMNEYAYDYNMNMFLTQIKPGKIHQFMQSYKDTICEQWQNITTILQLQLFIENKQMFKFHKYEGLINSVLIMIDQQIKLNLDQQIDTYIYQKMVIIGIVYIMNVFILNQIYYDYNTAFDNFELFISIVENNNVSNVMEMKNVFDRYMKIYQTYRQKYEQIQQTIPEQQKNRQINEIDINLTNSLIELLNIQFKKEQSIITKQNIIDKHKQGRFLYQSFVNDVLCHFKIYQQLDIII